MTEQMRIVKVIETKVTTYLVKGEPVVPPKHFPANTLMEFDDLVKLAHSREDTGLTGLTFRKESETSHLQVKTEWQLINDRPEAKPRR